MRQQRSYRPRDYYERDCRVQRVIEAFHAEVFCPQEPDLFARIYRAVLDEFDAYCHLADLPAYPEAEAQAQAGAAFSEQARWARLAIVNIARMGKVSSDRAVGEYARSIWDLKSVEVTD
jgi:starch phosphorylase